MKKVLVFCVLLALALSLDGSGAWAIDVGWMQKGVRVWYYGAGGDLVSSSDAEEAYSFTSINGNTAQLTHNSGINHWSLPTAETVTGSIINQGPFWIHPQVLQTIAVGNTWMGINIASMNRTTYTYETFKNIAEFSSIPYLLLPIKALFDLKPQREIVKLVSGIPYWPGYDVWGTTYFDAETGLCLLNLRLTVYNTVFFILSEINYDFATQRAFAEDNGPHTGFKSIVSEQQISDHGMSSFFRQSSVETRYGRAVQMWTTTTENGTSPPNENYCFFGSVPVLRHINQTLPPTPNYPPENWNAYGQYLWWWVPRDVLHNSTINVFGVPMTRTSTSPYTFTATQQPAGLFFSKLWFDNDGYMTAFAAKDSTTGLDIDPGYTSSYWNQSITIDGLNYYKNTMGIATPVRTSLLYADFAGSGIQQWDIGAWSQLNALDPTIMVASGAVLYVSGVAGHAGIWKWDGTSWSQLNSINPTNMVASGSTLYVNGVPGNPGIWKWEGSAWSALNSINPTNMIASGSTLYVNGVPGNPGVWKWDGSSWSRVNPINPTNMIASGSILYVSGVAGNPGVWKWDGAAWSALNSINPTNMIASGSVLYVDGVAGNPGVWKWDGTSWSRLNSINSTNMVASGPTLYVSGVAGNPGVWKWDGSSWSKLNSINPTNMVALGSELYVSGVAGNPGIWKWDGTAWSQVNPIDPASMIAN